MGEIKAAFGSNELLAGESCEVRLIERANEGDELAFREIVRTHETMVFNLALRCTGNFDDACDITQDVFLKAFVHLGRFRKDASLKTWLYRITLNVMANRNRWWSRKKRSKPISLQSGMGGTGASIGEQIPSSRPTPEEEAARNETRDHIYRALGQLSSSHRLVVVLRDMEGFSYDEIASLLRISAGTVKSRLARARERLRTLLGDGTLM